MDAQLVDGVAARGRRGDVRPLVHRAPPPGRPLPQLHIAEHQHALVLFGLLFVMRHEVHEVRGLLGAALAHHRGAAAAAARLALLAARAPRLGARRRVGAARRARGAPGQLAALERRRRRAVHLRALGVALVRQRPRERRQRRQLEHVGRPGEAVWTRRYVAISRSGSVCQRNTAPVAPSLWLLLPRLALPGCGCGYGRQLRPPTPPRR